jgi:secreted PhoX family phosphatase
MAPSHPLATVAVLITETLLHMNKPVDLPVRQLDDEEITNHSRNPSFMDVLDARLSRRMLLRGGIGGAATAVLGGLAACGGGAIDAEAHEAAQALPSGDRGPITTLNFDAVAKSVADAVAVPAGYSATITYALGDPLDAQTPAYRNDGTDADFERRAGDHHDGMEYFGLSANGRKPDSDGCERGLLAINHEALTDNFLHPNGSSPRPRPAAESDKEVPAHGLSVVEVRKVAKKDGGGWSYVQDSAYNRRVTPLTPIALSGAAGGHALMRTKYSPDGSMTRGTINNCGTGRTPWGTFLTGEENWSGYFTRGASDNAARDAMSVVSLNRYGRAQGAASRHGWETSGADDKYQRWNISALAGQPADGTGDYRNEMNGYGYTVEMDAYDRDAPLKKRTSLGRFAHESAAFGKVVAGKPLAVYQGDDARGEYIYKFVSAATWNPRDARADDRMAVGDKYLDRGKLYVAKFNADGSGEWIELSIANPAVAGYAAYAFADDGNVAVNSRLAADAVGATKMDRPEWCATHPTTGEVYVALTNNSNRKVEATSASQQAVDAANPRTYRDSFAGGALGSPGNVNGHIIRIAEAGGESAATAFAWDVYLFGAQADADPALVNLSSLTDEQDFSSPDGLWFSASTRLAWIQTDDGAYTDVTNCMMLIGVPGKVGDGVKKTLSYTKADGSTLTVDTYVGKKPTANSLKRFLVGPVDCEITGLAETPDGKTVFVNIQHPGESISAANVADPSKYLSHWPGNAGYGAGGSSARPRSATLAITKDDGGRIGG